MILQTSAKSIAVSLVLGRAIAIVVGERTTLARSTAELAPGMLMERGWYAGAVPPIRVVDSRLVVLVSAPESDWIVKFGPFMNIAEYGSAVSEYSRGSLPYSDYEALKMGRASVDYEARVLADVQARNVKVLL